MGEVQMHEVQFMEVQIAEVQISEAWFMNPGSAKHGSPLNPPGSNELASVAVSVETV